MPFPNDGLINNLSAYERQKLVRERFLNNITDAVTAAEVAAIIAAGDYLTINSANFITVQQDLITLAAQNAVIQSDLVTLDNTFNTTYNNLLELTALLEGNVISRTTVLPGTATEGDRYIVRSDDGTYPNQIATWTAGAWVYTLPEVGNHYYVIDENTNYQWDGTSWDVYTVTLADVVALIAASDAAQTIAIDAAITAAMDMDLVVDATTNRVLSDADLVGNRYITMTNAAANTVTIPAGLTGVNPVTISQSGAGVTTFVSSGVTLLSANGNVAMMSQYAAVAVIPVGVDTYQLVGGLG